MDEQVPPPGYRLAPTPTRAYGCDFRSQLEARWAVFFQCSGIPWQYEPHSVTLPDGRAYLPDFVVWDSIYCEVKPYAKESEKALSFALANPRLWVLLLAGLPDYQMHEVLGNSGLWAGFRSDGEPLSLVKPPNPPLPWNPPSWWGTEVVGRQCPSYIRARGLAHTCEFKNGAVKIPKRIQKLYVGVEGPQP